MEQTLQSWPELGTEATHDDHRAASGTCPTSPRTRRRRTCAPSCPGPVARQIIARDEAVTSPSLDPRLPAGRAAGQGLRHRGRRRQPLPRLQRRHRRHRRRPRPPRRQRRHPRPGRRRPALLLERLLPAGLRRRVRAARRAGPDARRPRVPVQLRHRGRRGRPQAGPPPHRPAQRHRLLRRLPRPLARQPVAHRQQGPPAGRLRRRHAGHVPRPVLRSRTTPTR